MRLTHLADVLREAGLKVAEEPGWKLRGGEMGNIQGILLHHTAGPKNGNIPSLNTLIEGRPGLRGPLAQLGLGRDGTWYVVAAGKANHAGKGRWKKLVNPNNHLIGIEAENTGLKSDPWPPKQVESYIRGVAALAKHFNLTSASVIGHKEWAPDRKIDPTLDMNVFREKVKEAMARKRKAVKEEEKEVIEDFYVPAEFSKRDHIDTHDDEAKEVVKALREEEPEELQEGPHDPEKAWPWSKEEEQAPEEPKPTKVSSETTPTGMLENLGWTEYQAAALIAQAVVQSNLDPNASSYAVNKQPTTRENPLGELDSFGIMKWNPARLANLDNFVAIWNHDNQDDKKRNDLLTQVRFVDWELRNSEKEAAKQLRESTDVTEALRASIGYIRPPGWSKEIPESGSKWADRVAAAYELMNK